MNITHTNHSSYTPKETGCCDCFDAETGRFLLVAFGAISLMVAGGVCLHAGVNAYASLGALGTGTVILIIDLAVLGCKSCKSDEETDVPTYSDFSGSSYEPVDQELLRSLRGNFFKDIYNKKSDLNKLWMSLVQESEGEIGQKAALLVDSFLEIWDLSSQVNVSTKNALVAEFIDRLPRVERQTFYKVKYGDDELRVYPTGGDGSCGYHALLGDYNEGRFLCNAKESRARLANWIRKQETLPETIRILLDDFFFSWDKKMTFKVGDQIVERSCVPSCLKTDKNNKLRKNLFETYKGEEEVLEKFRTGILESFLDIYVKNTGQEILQDEIQLIAKCFEINLVLVQPGWANDNHTIQGMRFDYGDPKKEPVYVYFNGYNHYERAFLWKVPQVNEELL